MVRKFDLYKAPSSARRSIAGARRAISEGKAAFLVGAGFDRAIAGGASWDELVVGLFDDNSAPSDLGAFVKQWPTEMALWARYRAANSKAFAEKISDRIHCDPPKLSGTPLTTTLASLLSKSNLVVTFNFSEIVDRLLRRAGHKVISIDREDLPSFVIPRPEDRDVIYLVHVHGRCSPRSEPILDAWGYNILANGDRFYTGFLEQLFTQRDVISLGVSWTDPPLRNAAALVYRTKGYLGRAHIAMRYEDDKKIEAEFRTQPTSSIRRWCNAMRAAYGVDQIVVSSETNLAFLRHLNTALSGPDLREDRLAQIADFFDAMGDFESHDQANFLTTSAGVVAPTVHYIAQMLGDALAKAPGPSWVTAARIERHLRHHLYVYAPHNKQAARKALFRSLRNAAAIFSTKEWDKIDEGVRFDFAIGAVEVQRNRDHGGRDPRIRSKDRKARLDIAPEIWLGDAKGEADRLIGRLLDLGWESMAAKVLCDRLQPLTEKANSKKRSSNSKQRSLIEILDVAARAAALAKSSRSTRRQLKADVVAAMWNPDPQEGRLTILNAFQRSETGIQLEPALYSGLTAGLAVAHQRFRSRAGRRAGDPFEELEDSGVDVKRIDVAHLDYWLKTFGPQEYKPAYSKLVKRVKAHAARPS